MYVFVLITGFLSIMKQRDFECILCVDMLLSNLCGSERLRKDITSERLFNYDRRKRLTEETQTFECLIPVLYGLLIPRDFAVIVWLVTQIRLITASDGMRVQAPSSIFCLSLSAVFHLCILNHCHPSAVLMNLRTYRLPLCLFGHNTTVYWNNSNSVSHPIVCPTIIWVFFNATQIINSGCISFFLICYDCTPFCFSSTSLLRSLHSSHALPS